MSNNTTNNTQEIDNVLKGITKGEWAYDFITDHESLNNFYIHNYDKTVVKLIGNSEQCETNAKAICNAVNNTYGKSINPESVPLMLEALKNIIPALEIAQANDCFTTGSVLEKYIKEAKEAINKATL